MSQTDTIDGQSKDLKAEKLAALQAQFPELFSEGKLDIEKMKQSLDKDAIAGEERYRLQWAGKHRVFEEIAKRSSATLTLEKERSRSLDETAHVFIEGENLEVLRTLQKAYHNKVKMIYIDPPYNTGKDFVYHDNFRDRIDEYEEEAGNLDEQGNLAKAYTMNSKDGGQYHSNWLNMMYPRLYLARNLLRDDGVIFVSIDDNEVHNLRMMMNEIFGEENFVAQLSVLNNPKGRSHDLFFSTNHEYLLIYSNIPLEKGAFSISKSEEEIKQDYPEQDKKGKFRLIELRNTHREFGKHNRPNLYYPLYYLESTGKISVDKEDSAVVIFPDWNDGFEGCWTWGLDKLKKEIQLLTVKKVDENWKVYRKSYALGAEKKLKTIFNNKEYHTEKGQAVFNNLFGTKSKFFQSPKSIELLKTILQTRTNKNDIILDFFAGSGTTAHAVMQQNVEDGGNRKYICVQIPEVTPETSEARKAGYETISDIAIERIKRAAEQIQQEHPDYKGDLGVQVYRHSASHFPAWRAQHFDTDEALQTSLEDFVTAEIDGTVYDRAREILLKLGYPLTTKIEEKTGYLLAADGTVALLLDANATIDLESVLALKPRTIIVLDAVFQDDDQKINFALACKEQGITLQSL